MAANDLSIPTESPLVPGGIQASTLTLDPRAAPVASAYQRALAQSLTQRPGPAAGPSLPQDGVPGQVTGDEIAAPSSVDTSFAADDLATKAIAAGGPEANAEIVAGAASGKVLPFRNALAVPFASEQIAPIEVRAIAGAPPAQLRWNVPAVPTTAIQAFPAEAGSRGVAPDRSQPSGAALSATEQARPPANLPFPRASAVESAPAVSAGESGLDIGAPQWLTPPEGLFVDVNRQLPVEPLSVPNEVSGAVAAAATVELARAAASNGPNPSPNVQGSEQPAQGIENPQGIENLQGAASGAIDPDAKDGPVSPRPDPPGIQRTIAVPAANNLVNSPVAATAPPVDVPTQFPQTGATLSETQRAADAVETVPPAEVEVQTSSAPLPSNDRTKEFDLSDDLEQVSQASEAQGSERGAAGLPRAERVPTAAAVTEDSVSTGQPAPQTPNSEGGVSREHSGPGDPPRSSEPRSADVSPVASDSFDAPEFDAPESAAASSGGWDRDNGSSANRTIEDPALSQHDPPSDTPSATLNDSETPVASPHQAGPVVNQSRSPSGSSQPASGAVISAAEAVTGSGRGITAEAVAEHAQTVAAAVEADDAAKHTTARTASPVSIGSSGPTSNSGTAEPQSVQPSNAHPPVNPADVIEQVSHGLRLAQQNGRQLTARLTPPELGTLQVEISFRDGVLTARLEVQTASAQRLLLENMASLHDALARHGTTLDRIDVHLADSQGRGGTSHGDGDGHAFANEDQERQPQQEQSQRRDAERREQQPEGDQQEPRSVNGTYIDELDIQI